MQLVPVPTTPEYLNATFDLWSPFLPHIAHRSPWSVEQLLGKLFLHEVQPVLVLDDATQPVALLGLSIVEDNGRVAALVWLSGRRREQWQHLLAELERYLREHVECERCRPVCRPGWKRFLEKHGYKFVGMTADRHVIMEKVL